MRLLAFLQDKSKFFKKQSKKINKVNENTEILKRKIQSLEAKLKNALDQVNYVQKDVKGKLYSYDEYNITEHAILRYVERGKGKNIETLVKSLIRDIKDKQIQAVYATDNKTIVTVLPKLQKNCDNKNNQNFS